MRVGIDQARFNDFGFGLVVPERADEGEEGGDAEFTASV